MLNNEEKLFIKIIEGIAKGRPFTAYLLLSESQKDYGSNCKSGKKVERYINMLTY